MCVISPSRWYRHGRGHHIVSHLPQGVRHFHVLHQAGVKQYVFAVPAGLPHGLRHVVNVHLRAMVVNNSWPVVNAKCRWALGTAHIIYIIVAIGWWHPARGMWPHNQPIFLGFIVVSHDREHFTQLFRVGRANVLIPSLQQHGLLAAPCHAVKARGSFVINKHEQPVVVGNVLTAVHNFRRVALCVFMQRILCSHIYQHSAAHGRLVGLIVSGIVMARCHHG